MAHAKKSKTRTASSGSEAVSNSIFKAAKLNTSGMTKRMFVQKYVLDEATLAPPVQVTAAVTDALAIYYKIEELLEQD